MTRKLSAYDKHWVKEIHLLNWKFLIKFFREEEKDDLSTQLCNKAIFNSTFYSNFQTKAAEYKSHLAN